MDNLFLIAAIQSAYDFAGWYGVIGEDIKHRWANIFRVTKAVLDFPFTIYILYFPLDFNGALLVAFYIAKWCHLCDSFYNIYRYILTNKPTDEWGYWRWWTPLGLLRTNWWGFCVVKGYTEYDQLNYRGKFRYYGIEQNYKHYGRIGFSRGMVSIKEAWIQTAIGLISAGLIWGFWG
jgi:hypothetical protein